MKIREFIKSLQSFGLNEEMEIEVGYLGADAEFTREPIDTFFLCHDDGTVVIMSELAPSPTGNYSEL